LALTTNHSLLFAEINTLPRLQSVWFRKLTYAANISYVLDIYRTALNAGRSSEEEDL